MFFQVDSTGNRSQTTEAMKTVVDKWGKLDIFVPCAGVYTPVCDPSAKE
jgi:NADP-dependent 3-hydroxy acid dehydrogenase YdfG